MNRSFSFLINLLLLSILLLPALSCKKDKKSSTLIITVKLGDYPIKWMHVFTVPATSDLITDAYGIVKIEGIQPGIYDVYAEDGYASGKSTINLNEDEVREATIYGGVFFHDVTL